MKCIQEKIKGIEQEQDEGLAVAAEEQEQIAGLMQDENYDNFNDDYDEDISDEGRNALVLLLDAAANLLIQQFTYKNINRKS